MLDSEVRNTVIKITFIGGVTREYHVNNDIEKRIKEFKDFTITTCHPDKNEKFILKIDEEDNQCQTQQ